MKVKFKRGAFNFYLKENFTTVKLEIQKEQIIEKSIPSFEVFKRAREKFKNLPIEEKKKYLELENEDLTRYNAEKPKKIKRKSPSGPLNYYISDNFHEERKLFPNLNNNQIFINLVAKWKELSNEERLPYELKSSQALLKFYEEKLEEPEENE
eukprot:gene341-6755_t